MFRRDALIGMLPVSFGMPLSLLHIPETDIYSGRLHGPGWGALRPFPRTGSG